MLGGNLVPLDADVQALIVERRCSFLAACVIQALRKRVPSNVSEVIRYLSTRGVTEEEVRAGLAEAELAGLIITDGSDFRPGDAAFYWVNRFRKA